MSTSYDKVWTVFLNNCKLSDIDLPQSDEKRYEIIKNGVMLLNNKLRTNYHCDDKNEMIIGDMNDDHLLILAFLIRLVILDNQRIYFMNLWQPFAKDITIRNFSSQLKAIEQSIKDTEDTISRLIMNSEEDFL